MRDLRDEQLIQGSLEFAGVTDFAGKVLLAESDGPTTRQ